MKTARSQQWLGLSVAGLVASCAGAYKAAPVDLRGPESEPIATINGAELPLGAFNQRYLARMGGVRAASDIEAAQAKVGLANEMIDEMLLGSLSNQEPLAQRALAAGGGAPSREELLAFHANSGEQLRAQPFEQAAPQISRILRAARITNARAKKLAALRASARIDFALERRLAPMASAPVAAGSTIELGGAAPAGPVAAGAASLSPPSAAATAR